MQCAACAACADELLVSSKGKQKFPKSCCILLELMSPSEGKTPLIRISACQVEDAKRHCNMSLSFREAGM
jgi:hypothetical protein